MSLLGATPAAEMPVNFDNLDQMRLGDERGLSLGRK